MSIFQSKTAKFISAVNQNDLETVVKILSGCNEAQTQEFLNLDFQNGRKALHIAAMKGYRNMIEYLLFRGAAIDIRDQDANTPLALSIIHSDVKTTEAILSGNPNTAIKGRSRSYWSQPHEHVLVIACDQNKADAFEALLKHGARADAGALFFEMNDSKYQFYNLLIEAGYKPESTTYKDGVSIFEHFLRRNNCETILNDMLFRGKVDPNMLLSDMTYPLHTAAKERDIAYTGLLMSYGADKNLRDQNNMTPLDIASKMKCLAIAKKIDPDFKLPKITREDTKQTRNLPSETQENWVRMGEDKVAMIGHYAEIGKTITEIFNFRAHSHYSIIDNMDNNQQSATPVQSFGDMDDRYLKTAFDHYRAQGGTISETEALSPLPEKSALFLKNTPDIPGGKQ